MKVRKSLVKPDDKSLVKHHAVDTSCLFMRIKTADKAYMSLNTMTWLVVIYLKSMYFVRVYSESEP